MGGCEFFGVLVGGGLGVCKNARLGMIINYAKIIGRRGLKCIFMRLLGLCAVLLWVFVREWVNSVRVKSV